MNRRGFLRTALCAAGATIAATMAGKVDARESTEHFGPELHAIHSKVRAVPGNVSATLNAPAITITGPVGGAPIFVGSNWPAQPLPSHTHPLSPDHLAPPLVRSGEWQYVTGPDPSTYVNVEWGPDGRVAVIPQGAPSPWPNQMVRGMGIPVKEFPHYDPKYGVVFLNDLRPTREGAGIGSVAIAIAYLRELSRLHPEVKAAVSAQPQFIDALPEHTHSLSPITAGTVHPHTINLAPVGFVGTTRVTINTPTLPLSDADKANIRNHVWQEIAKARTRGALQR